jgi:hypothetical protein
MEPSQPILWSSLPEYKGGANAGYQGVHHSVRRSQEMVTGTDSRADIWHSHDTNLTRGIDLMVRPKMVPFVLSSPNDGLVLSPLQVLLRLNIEAFPATPLDAVVRIKGRNKQVYLNQVGIRCRHCAHVPTMQRMKGAVYFPSTTLGLYQAAQNMCSSHLQCGLCPEMPESIKTLFAQLHETKSGVSNSAGGRTYWAHCAQQNGLMDTELGIFPIGM